jgi:beta-mannosidase
MLTLAQLVIPAFAGAILPLSDVPIWRLTSSDGAGPPALRPVHNISLPSLVQLDLERAGVIANPLLGNRLDDDALRWIHDPSRNWTYATRFTAPAAPQGLLLVAQSLDTLATVRLNGVVVGSSTNMHVRMVLELPLALLRHGSDNTLAISFGDPVSYSTAEYAKHPCSCDGCCHFNATQYPIYDWAQGRPWIRKVQSHYGWNWGPASMPYGVPREICIVELDNTPLLEDMRVSVKPAGGMPLPKEPLQDNSTDFDVTLELRIRAAKFIAAGSVLSVTTGWDTGMPRKIRLPELNPGTNTVTVKLAAIRPALWWPHELLIASGHTRPAMYNITVSLRDNGADHPALPPSLGLHDEYSDTLRRRIGFRTAELVRDPAHDGNGTIFAWRINGVLLYVRGANIIPYDVFMTDRQVGRKQYAVSLQSAVAAHMSMVRVWGGGAYLGDSFYDEADELGARASSPVCPCYFVEYWSNWFGCLLLYVSRSASLARSDVRLCHLPGVVSIQGQRPG